MPTYHINRSRFLAAYLDQKDWRPAASGELSDFAMWCPYGAQAEKGLVANLPHAATVHLDDKLKLYRLLKKYACLDLMPPTWESLNDFLLDKRGQANNIRCFLKDALGAGGQGVYYFNSLKKLIKKLEALPDTSNHMVLQEAVKDPALIHGRQFKVRAFVLTDGHCQTFLFEDWLVVLYSKTYLPESDETKHHVSPNEGTSVLPSSALPTLNQCFDTVADIVNQTQQCLKGELQDSRVSSEYHLYGYDFIFDQNYRPWLIEINAYPNLERQDSIAKQLIQGMLKDALELVLGMTSSGRIDTSAQQSRFKKCQ